MGLKFAPSHRSAPDPASLLIQRLYWIDSRLDIALPSVAKEKDIGRFVLLDLR
jgi:hypothetical protein